MSSALDRLKSLTAKISSYELTRKENLARLQVLYSQLAIDKKVQKFNELFEYKAINLSGISLNSDTLGEIKEGRYLQILAIAYDKDLAIKSKNVSLGYFGKVDSVDKTLRDTVVEFVIRFRFEKSFISLEHYYLMLEKLK